MKLPSAHSSPASLEAGPRGSQRPPVLLLLSLAALSFWTLSGIVPRALRLLGLDAMVPPVVQLALIHVIGLGGVIWLALQWTDAAPSELFPLRRVPLRELAWLVAGMAGVSILGSEAANWMLRASGSTAAIAPLESPLRRSHVLLTLTVVAGIVPWTEELLFRGIVLDGLRSRTSAGLACLVSAVAFALFHLDPLQMPLAFVAGCLLAQWRLLTGSLLPCVVGHAVLNAFPFLLVGSWGDIPGYGFEREPSLQQPWSFNVLGIVLLMAGIIGMRRSRAIRASAQTQSTQPRAAWVDRPSSGVEGV